MALVKCPECGKEISDRAAACIHCGCPIQQVHTEQQYAPPKQEVYQEHSPSVGMAQRDKIFVIVLSAISIVFPLLFSREIGFRSISFVLSALPCVALILLGIFQPKKKDLYAVLALTFGAVINFIVPQFFYREPLTILGLISYIVFFSVIVLYWLAATGVVNNKSIPIIATVAYAVFGVAMILVASTYGQYMLIRRLVSVVSEVTLYSSGCILICDCLKHRRPKKQAATAQGGNYAYVQDAPSTGFAVLSFFFPIVGLVLYCVWRDTLPQRAKSAGIGGLLGFVIGVVLVFIAYGILLS
ncbi:MAG: zinc ribbon domain-containing protein [Phoenicibacter congonensis]|uniref:Zinc ribbon domain-containing protein n=1 Tax=Phoenicibacter congonensis TaxID=1944646 RepID=A0AA43RGQ1_9ACTN|nr:zinc ribbon domain-containing protein [Phoenicibacter congonensis]